MLDAPPQRYASSDKQPVQLEVYKTEIVQFKFVILDFNPQPQISPFDNASRTRTNTEQLWYAVQFTVHSRQRQKPNIL